VLDPRQNLLFLEICSRIPNSEFRLFFRRRWCFAVTATHSLATVLGNKIDLRFLLAVSLKSEDGQ